MSKNTKYKIDYHRDDTSILVRLTDNFSDFIFYFPVHCKVNSLCTHDKLNAFCTTPILSIYLKDDP